MKRVALLLFFAGWLVPLASAQDHFKLAPMLTISPLANEHELAGLGARAAIRRSLTSCLKER